MDDSHATTENLIPASLCQRLAGLELSPLAAWLIDPDSMRILWANLPAVALWKARDLPDLLARDLSGAPARVVSRTQAIVDQLRAGRTVTEEWTLYPRGIPTPVNLHFVGVPLPDGRIGMLNHALTSEVAADHTLLRGVEALRHTTVIVALLAPDGSILMQNPAAQVVFGTRPSWLDWFVDREQARPLLQQALAGEVLHHELWARTLSGERCLGVGIHSVRDPVTGQPAVLVHHTDETQRIALLQKLKDSLAVVRSQRSEILSLLAPILDLGEQTIAVPIIGTIDFERSAEIADRLLPAIVSRRAVRVVLELTGAVFTGEVGARGLLHTIRAIQLLGSKPSLCGLQPTMTRHLVDAGFDLSGVPSYRSLAHALLALRILSPAPPLGLSALAPRHRE